MRRAARAALPALSHWYGIQPWMVDDLTYGELAVYLHDLKKLPPVGYVVAVPLSAVKR